MKTITLFPLAFSFVAWVLTLCGLLSGRTGMYGNHVVSVYTSHFGRDLLNNSNLFNLDNSSILYTLMFTDNDTAPGSIMVPQPVVPKDPPRNKALVERAASQYAPASSDAPNLMSYVQPIYDFIADELRLNRTGFFYQTGYQILNTTSDKLGAETGRFIQRVRVVVPSAAISALQVQLLKLAQSYQIPGSDLAPRSQMLSSDQWASGQLLAAPETREYYLKSPMMIDHAQVEQIRIALVHDLSQSTPNPENSTLGAALASGDFRTYLDSVLRGSLNDLNGTLAALAADLDNPTSKSMPARVLRESRPYLANALRQYANTQVNVGASFAKTGFKIHDFYSIYMSQFCYGDELPNGKLHVVACQNINDLRDANIAPRIRATLRAAGSNRRVPETMKLGDGPESSIDGLVKITKLLFSIYLMGVITSGAAFWSTFAALFVPYDFQPTMDNICMLTHLFAYTTLVIVFALSLLLVLACKLVIGGVVSSLSGTNVAGWGFAIINIMAILMITIAYNFWIYIWMHNLRARAAKKALDIASRPGEETSSEKGLMEERR